ncbi:MAG: TonB-dependent receptor plug domain-containing protein [Gammaproteobacteria bacterium]
MVVHRLQASGRMRLVCPLFLWAVAALQPAAADVESPDDPEDFAPADLSPVQVTAGRHAGTQADVPQPVSIVTRAEIERQVPQTWTDLLRGEPGVFNQSSGPGQGIIIVRGLKGSEVLHLVDGMRLNNAFFRNAPTQFMALVDPYNIERIELVRGPASVLYGSDALGGVAQILTPEERFAGDDFSTRFRALTQYGSADASKATRLEAAAGREDFSLAGGFTFRDIGEQVAAGGERVPDTDYLYRAWNGKMLWSPQPGHELTLSASYSIIPLLARYHQIVSGFGMMPDSDFSFFQPNSRSFFHGRYAWRPRAGFADDVQLHVARQVIRDDRFNRSFQGAENELSAERSTLDGFTAQFYKSYRAHDLTWGLDLYHDEVRSAASVTSLATGESMVVQSSFPDGASSDDFGAYVNDSWMVSRNWLIDWGLRFNYARTDLPPADRGTGTDVEDSTFTGSVGARYELTPALSWSVNVGRGFRAPNVFDLGTLGERPNGRFNIPNPDLEPETVNSLDSGFKWYDERWTGQIFAFYSRYEDRISSVATGNPRPDGLTEVQSRNIASATYYGIESGARYHANADWEVYVTANYTHGEDDVEGMESPANRVPPLNGQLGVLLRPRPQLYFESYLLFADRQDRLAPQDLDDSRIDPTGTAGWGSLNVRLGWTPEPGYRIQLHAGNLLDHDYREHGSGIEAPGRGLAVTVEMQLQ